VRVCAKIKYLHLPVILHKNFLDLKGSVLLLIKVYYAGYNDGYQADDAGTIDRSAKVLTQGSSIY
jgi:hypothetical protein